ncbi:MULTISPECIES: hypothetical protein [unclassified Sphingomonas]|uniref:hypothetical protein n=1 Tax=Sphingomonas TaxID=13687 RepID=UPI0009605FF7|nr:MULTISPECIES: hypothetical protein [unclassified Sphingomonas]MBN8812914.1 hypothetical protein [Sphingomonas sp.]OJY51168.1 MAG: hypothetical protein BGP17_22735 [Sphingomonas sp. 67-41]
MSTPLFLILALPLGAMIFVAGWALGRVLDPVFGIDARLARLHRRRERRLARGQDWYFEELRSIEVDLAQAEAEGMRPRQNWLARPLVVLLPFLCLSLGVFALTLLVRPLGLGSPPVWIDGFLPLVLLLVGVRYLIDPSSIHGTRADVSRGLGFAFIGVSAVLLVLKFI